jgi:hypothetical protein
MGGIVEPRTNQIIELWVKYEEIAMHFNDLLIRLRTQALGGVATIVTAAGFLATREGTSHSPDPWGVVAWVSPLLLLAWGTIWIIDARYYSRLLRGAVVALPRLEDLSEGNIDFSHRVEEVVTRRKNVSFVDLEKQSSWPAHLFYAPVAAFLVVAVLYTLLQWHS